MHVHYSSVLTYEMFALTIVIDPFDASVRVLNWDFK